MIDYSNFAGQEFNRLTAIEPAPKGKARETMWKFRCDCGNEKKYPASRVKNGYIKSCGCLRTDSVREKLFQNLTGKRFNNLTVIELAYYRNHRYFWRCKCDCGNETIVDGASIKSGNTKACGCLQSTGWGQNRTHNMSRTRLYRIWRAMKARCYDENNKYFCNYGGRGINVCDEWREHFELFRDWALINGYTEDLTIDRIDNNGNYYPENCRWSTRIEQMKNTRVSVKHEYNGQMLTARELSDISGVPAKTISDRLYRGWSVEKAISIPKLERGGREHAVASDWKQ